MEVNLNYQAVIKQAPSIGLLRYVREAISAFKEKPR